MTAAVGAAKFAEHVQTSGVASATMELYWTDLAAAAADFVYRPVDAVVPRLLSLWKRVTAHLRVGARRSQSSDLYVLAGCTAVVLAHACHVLGRSREGMVQVTTAKLCAEEAGHQELLAWALGTQALLVQASGRPRQALDMLSAAQEVLIRSRRSGTAATRLAAYRARFSSQVGDLEQTDAAIQHALDLDPRPNAVDDISDLDHIGGILSFGVAKRDFFLAEPYLRMGAFDEACRHAELAITTYTLGPEQQFSYGDVALAHLTAATARLSAGHLEAAVPSLTRVLDLPVAQRIQPLQAPLTEITQILHGPRYRGVAAANDLGTAIGDFRRPPQGIIMT
jgi:tetratricopeptide (TPR) repeat protein